MARRATVLKQERARNPNVLLLDAGDTLFGQPLADETQGKVIVDAMNLLGYAAMTLGESDLQLATVAVLRQRAGEARFPFLAANLSGPVPVKPYALVAIGGREIGILGLANADVARLEVPGGTFTISDPVEAARRYVPELRAVTNVVIVLSHLGVDLDQRLAKEVPGITVIVGGHSRRFIQPPIMVGTTMIVQAGFNGEGLGLLRLQVDSEGNVTSFQGEVVMLSGGVPDDPEMRALIGPPRLP